MKRVYGELVDIDQDHLKEFYEQRAKNKLSNNVDAPVVLVGDRDPSKIEAWTNFETEHRLPLLQLDRESRVLEIGCGTGRISKYITPIAKSYLGIDYVKEFIDIVETREDIKKSENTHFIHSSIQQLVNGEVLLPQQPRFNRFIISGGVFMYINDQEVSQALLKISKWLEDNSIIYLSEPIALNERLTLNKFYSESLESEYSAIYRTEEEYKKIFHVLYEQGFTLRVSEEFFYDDIKAQKETKQWIFLLERSK